MMGWIDDGEPAVGAVEDLWKMEPLGGAAISGLMAFIKTLIKSESI